MKCVCFIKILDILADDGIEHLVGCASEQGHGISESVLYAFLEAGTEVEFSQNQLVLDLVTFVGIVLSSHLKLVLLERASVEVDLPLYDCIVTMAKRI